MCVFDIYFTGARRRGTCRLGAAPALLSRDRAGLRVRREVAAFVSVRACQAMTSPQPLLAHFFFLNIYIYCAVACYRCTSSSSTSLTSSSSSRWQCKTAAHARWCDRSPASCVEGGKRGGGGEGREPSQILEKRRTRGHRRAGKGCFNVSTHVAAEGRIM